jgi:hypothetical protein
MRLVRWRRWVCLLTMSLLVGLHVDEGLEYNLHQLILRSNQLFNVDRFVVVVAGMVIALAVSCVHHLVG